MADLKISALNSLAGADLVAADVVAVVDDSASETKKLTVSDLIANGTTLISDATIPSAKILFSAGAIDTAELAASSVETAKINDSAVTAAKLADNSSVTLVSTLPGSGDFIGQIALDTDDNSIVVWNGSAWLSPVASGSINVINGSTTGEVNIVATKSGSTVTISATLDDTTAAAQFLAGPTGAGGTVGYRAIIGTDLPTATTSAKGGVIVNGNGLVMSGDTITINNSVTAETSENHIVQYDANGLVTGGRAIAAGDIPLATSSVTGAVKPGSGLEVTGAGAINHSNTVTGATAAKVTFDAQGHITASEALAATDIPDLDAAKITTGTLPTARLANDAVTADKLADRSTATIAETTPAGGDFIGQCHLNSITGDYFLWDGNVWQPIGISVGEIVLAGTYDASTNLVATVTAEGTAVGFTVGSALPAASSSNKGHYVIVSEAGTGTSPAPTVALNPPDFLLSTGTVYTEIDVSDTVTAQQASNVQFTAAGNISATNVQSAIEELDTEKVGSASPTFTGTVSLDTAATLVFEGASANDFETTLTVVDPTADRTVSLPNVTGTLISSGDTGTVTSTMILDGTIANADISSSAEIAVSKLANGTARQLLQTDAAGSGVEFTSNIDVPGTLDVTGAATLDSTLGVTGLISADGKVKFPAGTASAPSFYSGTDTNTGLYFSAADEVSITTGGTQRVVVDGSGRVLVGASSAASVASNQFKFNVSGESFTDSGTVQVRYGASGGPTAIFANARGTTASPATLQDSDELGKIRFYGHDGTDFANYAAAIQAEVDGTPGSNDMPGRLIFQTTADGASSPTERLRIDSSGRLLIGTTTAGAFTNRRVSIATSSGTTALELRSATDGDSRIVFTDSTSSSDTGAYKGQIAYDQASDYMSFNTNGNNERVRIDSSGNVGIGTTSPLSELHVEKATQAHITVKTASSNMAKFGSKGNDVYIAGTSSAANVIFKSNVTSTDHPADSGTERMRIDSSGNVGIGLNTSLAGLCVNNTIRSQNTSGNISYIGFTDYTGNTTVGTMYSYMGGDGRNTGYLNFSTNDTERMRIDSSGRVAIGNTTPSSFAGNGADNLVVGSGSGDEGIAVYSGASNQGSITFADGTSGDAAYRGAVEYNHSTDKFQFRVGGTASRVTIDSSGNATFAGTVDDSKGDLRDIPQNSKTAAYTLVANDAGKHINITTGGVTVPSGVFSTGDAVTIYNDSSSDQTVTQGGSVTLRSAGTANTGNRTLAQRGICTLLCVASNEFVISGAGLS